MLRTTLSLGLASTAVTAALVALPHPALAQSLTLTDAVDAALASHPSVSAAQSRVGAADGAGDVARAARLPGASVQGTLTRFQEPMIVAPLHGFDLTNVPSFDRTLVQGQLTLGYTIFDGGARSSRIRGADAMVDASRYGLSAAEMAVIDETATAYVGVLAARAVLEAARAQVDALTEEADRAQRAYDAGTAAEVEVLRARATLQEARAQHASAEARTDLSVRALARLMGTDAGVIDAGALADVTAGETASDDLDRGAAASPIVLQADRAVRVAEATLTGERAGSLPTVQAGAGILDFGTLDGGHTAEWQAGLQVSWRLFSGGSQAASVRRAQAELAAAQSDLDAARLQVAQAVDAAQTAVVEADARAEALQLGVEQWEEVARIEALALDAGSGVQADLLRAQAGLFQARAGHAQARYDAVLSRIRLARAEGTLDRAWMDEALEISR
jgi:outer membrane protein TolC